MEKLSLDKIDRAGKKELADKTIKANREGTNRAKWEMIEYIDKEYFKRFLDKIDLLKEHVDLEKVENILNGDINKKIAEEQDEDLKKKLEEKLVRIEDVERYIDEQLSIVVEKINKLVEEDNITMIDRSSFSDIFTNSVLFGVNGLIWMMENIDSINEKVQAKINNRNSARRVSVEEHFRKMFEKDGGITYYLDELCDDDGKLKAEITSGTGFIGKFKEYFKIDPDDLTGSKKLPYFRFFSELEKPGDITRGNMEEKLEMLDDNHVDKTKIKAFVNKNSAHERRKEQAKRKYDISDADEATEAIASVEEKRIKEKWMIREKERERTLAERENSFSDQLTGLPNRRRLEQELDRRQHTLGLIENKHIQEGDRREKKFSLIMFDLDGFKKINDTLGHDAGDEVLQKVAEILRSELRKDDVPIRLGGDEFMVIAENDVFENDDVLKLAERIRGAIEEIEVENMKVTTSVGISPYFEDSELMQKRADQATYVAKGKGKEIEDQGGKVYGEFPREENAKNQIWQYSANKDGFVKYEG